MSTKRAGLPGREVERAGILALYVGAISVMLLNPVPVTVATR